MGARGDGAGTGIALLEATIVNVALTTLGRDLDAGVDEIQWVVDASMLTLASLILFGGALGDRIGRRNACSWFGIVWFTVASALCAVAPSAGVLIAARAMQGVGGALLTPGSLAIIEAARSARSSCSSSWPRSRTRSGRP